MSGESQGLDFFLKVEECISLCRNGASAPWLFPLREDASLARFAFLRDDKDRSYKTRSNLREISMTFHRNLQQILEDSGADRSWQYCKKFYFEGNKKRCIE